MTQIQKILLALLLACIVNTVYFFKKTAVGQNKILILTTSGGGGNLAASDAIELQLKNGYEVEAVNVFKDLLKPIDPISYFTLNRYSGEELYNAFVPSKSFKILSLFYYVGAWAMQLRRTEIQHILHDYFVQTKPSLIISVIPLINNIILDAAQELNIPFMMVPTDLDMHIYLRSLKDPSYKNFKLCLPFDDKLIMPSIEKANIPNDQIAIVGIPLKPDFFTYKNKPILKHRLHIPKNKPIVMLLMGTNGSDIENYTKELLKITQPVHLIICVGTNDASKQAVSALTLPAHITMSVVGFTKHIADYMGASDLLITKSGTLSVCEAIYMNLPMLLDATSTILPWEKFNHTFIKEHHFGDSIPSYSMIEPMVTELLTNKSKLNGYKENLKNFKKIKNLYEIRDLVKQMLKST
jgi:processive 1,2-diacylglycerol beta-glucosyltransferase